MTDPFEGFTTEMVATTGGAHILTRCGGSGPPLLLLHGYPQTHFMWHRIVGQLARHHRVVVTDLRGYGDSIGPAPAEDASNYRFRDMALDQVEVMRHLGHESFLVAGHDRGARTAFRLALDHPGAVRRLALLDVQPTHHAWTRMAPSIARRAWFWILMAQDGGIAEQLFTSAPREWLFDKLVPPGPHGRDALSEEAVAEYLRCFTPSMIRASCADYRAFSGLDVAMEEADLAAGRKVACPTLVLWGEHSYGRDDMVAIWRDYVADVGGGFIAGAGHYLAEEAPRETAAALLAYFRPG
jgi:haloacetate dehalogenase